MPLVNFLVHSRNKRPLNVEGTVAIVGSSDLLADEEIKVLKKYKVWAKKKFMGREFMGIVRTTFLIDKKGKIIKIWNNVKVKDHAKEVLETLQNIVKK